MSWNPLRKQKQLAIEMNVSKCSITRILHGLKHFGAYRRSVSHLLNKKLLKKCLKKYKKLLKRFAKHERQRILFANEKILSIEEKFNCQNDRVYACSCYEALEKAPHTQCGHQPPWWWAMGCVMVWRNRDSFLQTGSENEWCSLSKYAGGSNSTSGGYHLQRCTGLLLPAELSPCTQGETETDVVVKRMCQTSSAWRSDVQQVQTSIPWVTSS